MWISKKQFNEMEKRLDELSLSLERERDELRELKFNLERETARANRYEKLADSREKIIQEWKARLREREDVFIGKTIKKLIASTNKTHIIERHPPIGSRLGGIARGISGIGGGIHGIF